MTAPVEFLIPITSPCALVIVKKRFVVPLEMMTREAYASLPLLGDFTDPSSQRRVCEKCEGMRTAR